MTYTRTDGHVNIELEFCAKNSQQRQRHILASFSEELVNQPAPPRLSAVASSGCITTHLAAIKRCKVVSIPLHRWTSNNQPWFIPTTPQPPVLQPKAQSAHPLKTSLYLSPYSVSLTTPQRTSAALHPPPFQPSQPFCGAGELSL